MTNTLAWLDSDNKIISKHTSKINQLELDLKKL